ncbi:NAD-dependent epimerase/dehydratase family protein [Kribbella solani]|uniref:Nucleoside-diphosphate-sugar epimerase n=1 Tax=Kribbella solani TaxID=236067 RepID=A0A841E3F1_9ACTN|nr:NAD-dependent epimerase/dehydratase family protein [Kribbella solani]MBB5983576.1 nucleoside-diphosphate-sugar epimerase [Kribbella solani]MDX2973756.1 NAD(P)-dependent oxidoreductase [Kribbella solani]MDX3002844.1 NAD(P)-dependent oxidoreductase [Kribbella solani]
MKRVLVTGADGSIGRAAVVGLQAAGYEVTGLSLRYDHTSTADRPLVGDARSADDVGAALDGVDAVLHLAAIPHPSLGTPEEVFENNVAATFNVLAQAGQQGIGRAVIASSINAFGVPMNVNQVVPAYYPLDEEVHADISDAYSLSKSVDEQSARMAWRRWGTDVIALRFPLVKDHAELLKFAARAERDPSGMAREGWAYLDLRDGVRAIIAALESTVAGAHVVGLAADDILIDRQTDELLREYAPTVPLRRPVHGRDALVDTARAKELLGFTPRFSIHDDDQVVSAVTI